MFSNLIVKGPTSFHQKHIDHLSLPEPSFLNSTYSGLYSIVWVSSLSVTLVLVFPIGWYSYKYLSLLLISFTILYSVFVTVKVLNKSNEKDPSILLKSSV